MKHVLLPFFALSALLLSSASGAVDLPLPDGVASRVGPVHVDVAPDRPDWTYSPGDRVTFTIQVTMDGLPLPGAEIEYQIGPEKFLSDSVKVTLPDGRLTIGGQTMDQPGFLRCMVTTTVNGREYRNMATAAFAPLEIQPTQVTPDDFDAFWDNQLNLLAEVPLKYTKRLVPELCTPEVNAYEIRYLSWGDGVHAPFYGILTEPSKPGSYPAVLRVPGAGVRAYSGMADISKHGVIVLEIGIHGIPVTMEDQVYLDLRAGALRGYNMYRLEDRDQYYYRRVYLGCVRGNDVLVDHPMWNGKDLVVCGGSQGGQLSIVTSALDKRVTGTVSNYPAYCDVTGYLHGRAGGWPHMFRGEEHRTEDKITTTAYYDALNFARRLHAPIDFAFGFNDVTCPPTSMAAAYNVIPSEKQLHLQLNMGHGASSEFNALFAENILRKAGVIK